MMDQPTQSAVPLLAARPRIDTRRHSDSAVVSLVSSSASPTANNRSIASKDSVYHNPLGAPGLPDRLDATHVPGAAPSPPCPTPHANDLDNAPREHKHVFSTRIPCNPSDLRAIQWRLTPDRLTCLDSTGALVVEFALHELVWRPDGMYGIEFGLDSRFVVAGEDPEMAVEEAATATSSSSSLGTIASESAAVRAGGAATSMSRELLAALQQESEMQNNSNTTGSTGTVIVRVSDQGGSFIESTDSFLDERNPRMGVMSRPGTAVDAGRAGTRTASTDPEPEESTDSMGYMEGFRIYSENTMEVSEWLSILAEYRTRHPLIPRITFAYADLATHPIDSYDSIAPPANTRRNSAAIGDPEALLATVVTHLHSNATPAAVRLTIVPTANIDFASRTPPGSVGSALSLSSSGATNAGSTAAKFIRILDAAHGPVVVSTTEGGRVVVKDMATGKTVLDVRDSLEILHEKMRIGAVTESPQSSLGSLQSVDNGNQIPLMMGKPPVTGYKVPLKGDSTHQLPQLVKEQEMDVEGEDTLGNAQWKVLKASALSLTSKQGGPVSSIVITGHPTITSHSEADDEEALGDTLKGSTSAMRLKGAVLDAAEQTRQDAVGLGQLGM